MTKPGNRTSETIQGIPSAPASISGANYNGLNQLTNTTGPTAMRFKGHLDELGTVKVAGSNAPVDSRTTNFTGYASVSLGTNVVPVVATDYSGNVRSNRYQVVVTNGSSVKTMKYDLNGNLTNLATATYTNTYEWDGGDRLVAINAGTNRSEFTYDGLGRRVKILEKQNGTAVSTNYFVWCGTDLCEQRSFTNVTVSKRFFGGGEQISGTNYCFTRDHLGNVREMTDSTAAIRARYDYDPYGRRSKVSGNADADFGFTGHYFHAISGLHLAPYRAYDAEAGRWLSRDPVSEQGGSNLYRYVENNPQNGSDPLGLWNLWNPATWGDSNANGWSFWNSLDPSHGSSGYTAAGLLTNTGQGLAAWADGFIPFWDPFANAGIYDPCDKALSFSHAMGGVSRDALMVAVGQPTVAKPFITPGSSSATSVASSILSKIPIRMPFRIWAPTAVRPEWHLV